MIGKPIGRPKGTGNVSAVEQMAMAVYIKQFPDATYSEIQDWFQQNYGKTISTGSIFNYIGGKKNKESHKNRRLVKILDKAENLIAKSIAHTVIDVVKTRNNIIQLTAWRLEKKLANMDIDFNAKTLSDIHSEMVKIDNLCKGQPTEIHKYIHGWDDNLIDHIIKLKDIYKPEIENDKSIINGELCEEADGRDVAAAEKGIVPVGGGGESKENEGRENPLPDTDGGSGEIHPSETKDKNVYGREPDGQEYGRN